MSISKINLIQEIEFLERFEKIGDILLKWSEKSGDKNLKVCKSCLADIGIYVSHLEADRRSMKKALLDYKNRIDKLQNLLYDKEEDVNKIKKENKRLREEVIENFGRDLKH